jgi:hypothetical protein
MKVLVKQKHKDTRVKTSEPNAIIKGENGRIAIAQSEAPS